MVLADFKSVAGRREAAWVGSIPTRLRQTIRDVSLRRTILNKSRWLPPIGVLVLACTVSAVAQERVSPLGRELLIKFPTTIMRARIFLIERRMYTLGVTLPYTESNQKVIQDTVELMANRYFASFKRLTSKK